MPKSYDEIEPVYGAKRIKAATRAKGPKPPEFDQALTDHVIEFLRAMPAKRGWFGSLSYFPGRKAK